MGFVSLQETRAQTNVHYCLEASDYAVAPMVHVCHSSVQRPKFLLPYRLCVFLMAALAVCHRAMVYTGHAL